MQFESHCPACGAPYTPKHSPKGDVCAYCGTLLKANEPVEPVENVLQPEEILDFSPAEREDTFEVATEALKTTAGPSLQRLSRRIITAIVIFIVLGIISCICLVALLGSNLNWQ